MVMNRRIVKILLINNILQDKIHYLTLIENTVNSKTILLIVYVEQTLLIIINSGD